MATALIVQYLHCINPFAPKTFTIKTCFEASRAVFWLLRAKIYQKPVCRPRTSRAAFCSRSKIPASEKCFTLSTKHWHFWTLINWLSDEYTVQTYAMRWKPGGAVSPLVLFISTISQTALIAVLLDWILRHRRCFLKALSSKIESVCWMSFSCKYKVSSKKLFYQAVLWIRVVGSNCETMKSLLGGSSGQNLLNSHWP